MNEISESCPFCGGEPGGDDTLIRVIDWFEGEDHPFAVECGECGTVGPIAFDPETAIELWNTRDAMVAA